MSARFKVGDSVRCIYGLPDEGLYEGVTYVVRSEAQPGSDIITVEKDAGKPNGFFQFRFKLVAAAEPRIAVGQRWTMRGQRGEVEVEAAHTNGQWKVRYIYTKEAGDSPNCIGSTTYWFVEADGRYKPNSDYDLHELVPTKETPMSTKSNSKADAKQLLGAIANLPLDAAGQDRVKDLVQVITGVDLAPPKPAG
jgi:hypothetical protein